MSKVRQPRLVEETEFEMRDSESFWPETEKELINYVKDLLNRKLEYGTAVYAVSLATVAMFNYMGNELGISGFQASCADLDVIRRTRRLQHPFKIVDYGNLLYPQLVDDEHFPSWESLIKENAKWLKEEAQKLINEHTPSPDAEDADTIDVHENVMSWWKHLASLEIND